MRERKNVTVFLPESAAGISMADIKLCELFLSYILDSCEPIIDIKVDSRNSVVFSQNKQIRELISIYLKTGKIFPFYRQLMLLGRKKTGENIMELKFEFAGKAYFIDIQECAPLPNLHLNVKKATCSN